jgi:hypothetical protein
LKLVPIGKVIHSLYVTCQLRGWLGKELWNAAMQEESTDDGEWYHVKGRGARWVGGKEGVSLLGKWS